MNLERFLTKRNLTIAAIFAGILLIIFIMFLGLRAPRSVGVSFAKMAFQYPLAIDNRPDGSLIFSNGRSFVSYQPSDGATRRLTPPAELPNIGTLLLRPDGSGALFQTINHSTTDVMASTLTSRSLSLDEPYWWYVDFAKNSYTLLTEPDNGQAQKFRTAHWLTNDEFLGATPLETQTQMTVQTPTGVKQQFVLNGTIDSFTVRDNQLRYQTGTKLYTTPMGTNQPTELLGDVASASFSPKNDWVYISKPIDQSNNTTSYLYNTATKQKTFETVTDEISPLWSTDGNWVFLTANAENSSQSGVRAINVNDLRQTSYTSNVTNLEIERIAFAENDQLFVAVDSSMSLYFASTNPQTASKWTVKDTRTVSNDTTSINYFGKEGYFIASITGEDTPAARNEAERLLGDAGVTADLVQMRLVFLPPTVRDGPQ